MSGRSVRVLHNTNMTNARVITYANPIWPGYFADPFVLRTSRGKYYAYGTAPPDERGRQFPVLRSTDLVNWEPRGHALQPLHDSHGHAYWAPEVAEHDGRFFMFYSASTSASDEHHRLRVAVSDAPHGPFVDSGSLLIPDSGFTIDASPFREPRTGKWFLFFAADYTDDAPHGTGLAVAPLSDDLLRVTGAPRPVARASCPWHVYGRDRDYKGRVWPAWHCIEGPFVVYHADRYWCLYSGGNWQNETYGVGFAVADDPLGPWLDEYAERGPTVLKGAPPKVIGPGHCCVVMGPDDRTPYVVYHAWDESRSARRMCIDPLVWTDQGPRCDGPSTFPREMFVTR